MIKFILGLIVGGAVSVVFMALCNAASAADQRLEELSRKRDSEPKEAGKYGWKNSVEREIPSRRKPVNNDRRQSL